MKLLMETWRRYLAESQKEPGLLYHATLSPDGGRSFIENGIDSQRSGGFGQGAGFYLWADRESAQRYIKGLLHGMSGGTAGCRVLCLAAWLFGAVSGDLRGVVLVDSNRRPSKQLSAD